MAYELIDHTGDIGVVARAPTLEELFAECARAMFAVLADAPQRRRRRLQPDVALEEIPGERPEIGEPEALPVEDDRAHGWILLSEQDFHHKGTKNTKGPFCVLCVFVVSFFYLDGCFL